MLKWSLEYEQTSLLGRGGSSHTDFFLGFYRQSEWLSFVVHGAVQVEEHAVRWVNLAVGHQQCLESLAAWDGWVVRMAGYPCFGPQMELARRLLLEDGPLRG